MFVVQKVQSYPFFPIKLMRLYSFQPLKILQNNLVNNINLTIVAGFKLKYISIETLCVKNKLKE